jgi:hypothetical protein
MTFRFISLLFVTIVGMGSGFVGCGGKGGGPNSGTFTPATANPGAHTIILSGAVRGADLYLTVKANAVTDSIVGTAFDLIFDPNILTYVDHSPGVFFEQTGAATYAVAARGNRLVVGVSKQQPGVVPSGTGAFITLHFKIKAAGVSVMTFESQALCSAASATGCDRQPVLPWYGGTYSHS